jgi:hypothetical protein
MLDYAMIAKSKGRAWGNLDATIAFLQACSYMHLVTTLALTQYCLHRQTHCLGNKHDIVMFARRRLHNLFLVRFEQKHQ